MGKQKNLTYISIIHIFTAIKMNWHEYPIVRLLVPFLLGISCFLQFPDLALPWQVNLLTLAILAFLAWPRKYLFPYRHRYFSGLFIYFSFFLLGFSISQNQQPSNKTDYIGNYADSSTFLLARITEAPVRKAKSIKLLVDIEKASSEKSIVNTTGLAILYLKPDSLANLLEYNDYIIIRKQLSLVRPPGNPDEFDYKNYLYQDGIKYTAYLNSGDWQRSSITSFGNIKSLSNKIRHVLLEQLQKHNIKNAEFSVAAAMLLGVRSNLSPELQKAFSGAGAMHILCVSGLHVGIIYMLLNFLLSFLNPLKKGKKIKIILIILSIWLYALITGLSPSVVRAATMFSFIGIGQNLRRHVNIYNTLAASAFILLIFNPFLISNVGFQLSYAAVIAIVTLQRPLQDLWTPGPGIVFRIWQLICVSVAAQIGTAPLALYYFHNFPNYFLLTNLIVIPAAFIIFIGGIVVLFFFWWNDLADILGLLLAKIIQGLNFLVTSIESIPGAVSSNNYISTTELIILILLSILIPAMLLRKSRKLLFINLLLLILFLLADIHEQNRPPEFIVYNSGRYNYIAFMQKGKEYIISRPELKHNPHLTDYQTLGHRIYNHIHERKWIMIDDNEQLVGESFYRYRNFIGFVGKRIAIVSPTSVQKHYNKSIAVDYLVVMDNPKARHADILKQYSCEMIIIASTNSPWNTKKMGKGSR